ncbi:Lsr2 family DNA-binding protein [Amycolatopsis sp. NBC_01488]|uniref:Lsr2 family DNA-binding protein n=1 Tax=Amycolatopsis sp. NBC_01488 TaxID=2903563 RepID=UPI003FA43F94
MRSCCGDRLPELCHLTSRRNTAASRIRLAITRRRQPEVSTPKLPLRRRTGARDLQKYAICLVEPCAALPRHGRGHPTTPTFAHHLSRRSKSLGGLEPPHVGYLPCSGRSCAHSSAESSGVAQPFGPLCARRDRPVNSRHDGPRALASGPLWASEYGYEVSERGRLSSEIVTAYDEAQRQAAQPAPAPARKRALRKKVAAAKK